MPDQATGQSQIDARATAATRARYDRIAPFYDLMEATREWGYHRWREKLWQEATGSDILEVGVGTGKNLPHYPRRAHITAIDLSPRRLERARRRVEKLRLEVDLRVMDAQALEFADNSFDTAVATFVFCSVPDPVLGLEEIGRVVQQGGKILLLEHVRAQNPAIGRLMDWVNPLIVRTMGFNLNRRTLLNIQRAGLVIESVENLALSGIFKFILARPVKQAKGMEKEKLFEIELKEQDEWSEQRI